MMEQKFLKLREAAKYLGVSVSQMYRLINQGRIDYRRPTGGMYFFEKEALDEFMRGKDELVLPS
jgi:excisionase family DNA binding protein